tara:strand:+ start:1588 stop:2073 length:486 start_codon:yes stop_codon:yes gene_type:complete
MEEVLAQDIISGKKYYVEYWGRVNDQGRTDSTKPPVLLKKYYGRIDEGDRGVLALREAVQIQNGVKIPVVNNPFITIKPETPITFEQELERREGINYYYKFFPRKIDEINMRSVLSQKTGLDPYTANVLSDRYFGGKKRKTKRKKSKKRKTKKNKSKRKKV